MATTINGTTGRNSSYWRYYLVCTEQDVSVADNTSKLKVEVYLGATSYSRAVRGAITATHTVNVNGKNYTFDTGAYTIEKNTNYLLGTIITDPIEHNADGSKSVVVTASSPDLAQASGYGPYSGSVTSTSSGNPVTLTTIARYANLTSLSVKSRTINSVTLSYTTDRSAYIYCSLDGGTSWLNSGNPFKSNTTSGEFTVYYRDTGSTTRLAVNTTYNFTVLSRDVTSGLDNIKSVSGTTYDIAKLVSVPDVNIGSAHTITWTNPSGATTTLQLAKTDNTQIANIGTVTGTSKDYTATASTIYALTPNSNTYKARYIITTTANNQSYTNAKDFTFKVTNSNPTFTAYTYEDTNATTIALTGNNQILVKGYSNNKVTISTANKAIAKNSATMSTYKLVQGSKSTSANYSSSAAVTLSVSAIDSNVMTVYATDSRGNSTPIAKTLSSSYYKEYTALTIKSVTATRSDNGVGKGVTLKYNGTFWNASFGSVTNTIWSVTYQYKETSSSTWSSAAALTPTISSSNYSGSVSIQGDLGAEGFDVAKSYNIRLTVKDKLATKTYDIVLGSGTPAVAIYKDNVAIGQKYDTSEGSKLQVNGNLNIKAGQSYRIGGLNTLRRNTNNQTLISASGDSGDGNRIYFRPNGDSDTTGQMILDKNGKITINGNQSVTGSTTVNGYVNNNKINSKTIDANYKTAFRTQTRGDTSTANGFITTIRNDTANVANSPAYGSGLAFGRNDTHGYIYMDYNKPAMMVGAGNADILKWTEKVPVPTNLYNNTSGTSGTVTLSETSANFSYIDIFYYKTNCGYNSVRVYSPNGKDVNLMLNQLTENEGTFQHLSKRINISGTSITVNTQLTGYSNAQHGSTNVNYTENSIFIIRVDGYR